MLATIYNHTTHTARNKARKQKAAYITRFWDNFEDSLYNEVLRRISSASENGEFYIRVQDDKLIRDMSTGLILDGRICKSLSEAANSFGRGGWLPHTHAVLYDAPTAAIKRLDNEGFNVTCFVIDEALRSSITISWSDNDIKQEAE